MWVGWRWKERKRMGFSLVGDGLGREGKEEDLEGVIPQGPSGNSIGFWFPSQRNLFFAKSEKLFCKNIVSFLMPLYPKAKDERRKQNATLSLLTLYSPSKIIEYPPHKSYLMQFNQNLTAYPYHKRFCLYFLYYTLPMGLSGKFQNF